MEKNSGKWEEKFREKRIMREKDKNRGKKGKIGTKETPFVREKRE